MKVSLSLFGTDLIQLSWLDLFKLILGLPVKEGALEVSIYKQHEEE